MASYYSMKKFLSLEGHKNAKSALESSNLSSAENPITTEDAFKEFICPICMKLIQKCVTTLCGHSFCEACLEDYLIFKEVSESIF